MNFRSAKIVCTLGPASDSAEMIERLMRAGMDVARLNFSHGTHEDHARDDQAMCGRFPAGSRKPIGILADLQGPKIRTGALVEGKPVQLRAGQRFTISTLRSPRHQRRRKHDLQTPAARCSRGDRILLGDGLIELARALYDVELGPVHGRQRRRTRRAQGHQFARRQAADSRADRKRPRRPAVRA